MDTRDIHRYIEVLDDLSVHTVDNVMQRTGWPRQKVLEAHNEMVSLLNHITGFEHLREMWDIKGDIYSLKKMVKDCERDLIELSSQGMGYSASHKELRSQIVTAQKALAERRKDYEEIMGKALERDQLSKFVTAILNTIGEVDPVIAAKVRDSLVSVSTVFAGYIDHGGTLVDIDDGLDDPISGGLREESYVAP